MDLRKVVAVVAAGTGILGLAWSVSTPQHVAYKAWTLVTPKPLDLDPTLAVLCGPPSWYHGLNAHEARFYRVFVNPKGTAVMRDKGVFPVGSGIVKEKLVKGKDSFDVELLTVMTKGPKGSHPTTKDWDFYCANAAGERIPSPKGIADCVSCHQDRMADDMVFRTYVNGGKWAKRARR